MQVYLGVDEGGSNFLAHAVDLKKYHFLVSGKWKIEYKRNVNWTFILY